MILDLGNLSGLYSFPLPSVPLRSILLELQSALFDVVKLAGVTSVLAHFETLCLLSFKLPFLNREAKSCRGFVLSRLCTPEAQLKALKRGLFLPEMARVRRSIFGTNLLEYASIALEAFRL